MRGAPATPVRSARARIFSPMHPFLLRPAKRCVAAKVLLSSLLASLTTAPRPPPSDSRPSTGRHGDAGAQILIEEFLVGEEASIFAITDGDAVLVLERLDASLRQLYARLGWCEEPRRRYDPAPADENGAGLSKAARAAWFVEDARAAVWWFLDARRGEAERNFKPTRPTRRRRGRPRSRSP